VLAETNRRLDELRPCDPDDVRLADGPMVAFSPDMFKKVEELRAFLWENMYRHPRVARVRLKVSRIIEDLYKVFMDDPRMLPESWRQRVLDAGGPADRKAHARVVADYIAGMTDRFAIREHENLFDLYRDLR
jgi:dGTPase